MNKPDPIPARLAALKTTPTPDLKQQWRDLFDSEPPPFNRRYLESRLAYRIQELAYGGLKPETIRRLERLGEELDGGDRKKSRIRADAMPIVGTRLIREWQGVEQIVTVTADGFEWQGRPYKSLSPSRAPSPARGGTGGSSSASRTTGGGHDETAREIEGHPQSCAAPSTPGNPPRKGWSRSSTACMPSARPARLISPASAPRAG
jgi:hypothetical protein